jgi:hypothetical protein
VTDEELRKLFADASREFAAAEERNDAKVLAMREQFATLHRHFDVTAESLRHEIHLVAEGTGGFDEARRQDTAQIRDEIRRTAAETQAMIKFSHQDLDRRVTTLETEHRDLEETVAELQARVERLESTH